MREGTRELTTNHCPQCGHVYPVGSNFCPTCGLTVEPIPGIALVASGYCRQCRQPIDLADRFCVHCGAATQPNRTRGRASAPRDQRLAARIVTGAKVAAAVGLLVSLV